MKRTRTSRPRHEPDTCDDAKERLAETLLTTGTSRMAPLRKHLFSFLTRNARTPTGFFSLPPNRVVELGTQIEL